jgi:hypothetical protein
MRGDEESAIGHGHAENAAEAPRAYNGFSLNGNNPLNVVSHSRGAPQTLPPMPIARKRALDLSPAAEGTWHRPAFTHLSGLLEPFQIADKPIWPRWINSYAYHLPSLRSQTVGLTEKRLSG